MTRDDNNADPTETEKLLSLTENSQYNLFIARTVFPFVLFADTIKIDRQKLTIVHNDFFRVSQTSSVEIKKIINVQTDLGVFFGSIIITSDHFRNNTQRLKFLKRKDAVAVQCLLEGFMIAHRANIDTDNIERGKLFDMLSGLGKENMI